MGRCVVLALLVIGCGRLRFDPRDDGGGTSDGDGAATACTFETLAVGQSTTCAIDNYGRVWCWGLNNVGQATGSPTPPVLAAAQVPLPAAAVEIGVGTYHACARLATSTVWCWGSNMQGQLGDGTTNPSTVPVQVAMNDAPLELEVGGYHACVRRASDNTIACWGGDKELGISNPSDTMIAQPLPVLIAGTAGTKSFELGHRHGCGFDSSDQIFCWGKGVEGQLGVGTANSLAPVRPTGFAGATAINAANRLTCVTMSTGAVRCWGTRYLGGASFDFYDPMAVLVPKANAVATSNYAACAIHDDGTVSCWGYLYDQMPRPVTTAVTPLAGVSGVLAIDGGWDYFCARTMTDWMCWGDDREGQLGRGGINSPPAPAPITMTCDTISP